MRKQVLRHRRDLTASEQDGNRAEFFNSLGAAKDLAVIRGEKGGDTDEIGLGVRDFLRDRLKVRAEMIIMMKGRERAFVVLGIEIF